MSTLAKYWDKYSKRGKPEPAQEARQHMTDREAYISFLEVQLERVTQSVLVTQGFSDRIEQLQAQVNTSEDRVMTLVNAVRLQRDYGDEQDKEMQKVTGRIERLEKGKEDRVSVLEEKIKRIEEGGSREPLRVREGEDGRGELRMMALLKDQKGRVEEQMDAMHEKFLAALEKLEGSYRQDLQHLDEKLSEATERMTRSSTAYMDKSRTEDMEHLLRVLAEEFKTMKGHMATIDGDLAAMMRRKPSLHADEGLAERLAKVEGIVVGTAESIKELEGKSMPDLTDMEKQITRKASRAIERLGELLKKYTEGQKTLHNSLTDLTVRVDRIDKGHNGSRKASPARRKSAE